MQTFGGFEEETMDWVIFLNIIVEKGTEMFMLIEGMTWKQILGLQRGICSRMKEGVMGRVI